MTGGRHFGDGALGVLLALLGGLEAPIPALRVSTSEAHLLRLLGAGVGSEDEVEGNGVGRAGSGESGIFKGESRVGEREGAAGNGEVNEGKDE